jgi:hypothetical protein
VLQPVSTTSAVTPAPASTARRLGDDSGPAASSVVTSCAMVNPSVF